MEKFMPSWLGLEILVFSPKLVHLLLYTLYGPRVIFFFFSRVMKSGIFLILSGPSPPSLTYFFEAPEVVKYTRWSTAADVWSYGVVLYSIDAQRKPYDDVPNNRIREVILAGQRLVLEGLSSWLKPVIVGCLQENPRDRQLFVFFFLSR
eukprot:TRINITY_DN6476_c0_g1_i1.p1 TRINITY_DN6476_c0_g1~~TRINITY_DN6476_c0_g1_i1.p1  ORF type:complete len:149 (-),score=21.30 TRINITY_DN6476_c0_g1_i1:63-509(-)